MKRLVSDERAVSVVVGSILVLAILVTFMSVVVSTWVPIYEGNDEAQHSDQTYKSFIEFSKQIDNADELKKVTKFDMGTEGTSFIVRSNSVGYLELNDSDGIIEITANLTSDPSISELGYALDVVGMNTSDPAPITNFSLRLQLVDKIISSYAMHADFRLQMQTSTLERGITLYAIPNVWHIGWPLDIYFRRQATDDMGIRIAYGEPRIKWETVLDIDIPNDPEIYVDNNQILYVNLLSNNTNLTLVEPVGQNITINGVVYNTAGNDNTRLYDLIQHYMRQPGDGTGGYYEIDYFQYQAIDDGIDYLTYKVTHGYDYELVEDNKVRIELNKTQIGGGTLELMSDYNFMVDQSYIYDNGAIILKQYDGSVFKVGDPIEVSNTTEGNITMTIATTILSGNYTESGNDAETLYTSLNVPATAIAGYTDNITITKYFSSEWEDAWVSYFETKEDEITSISNTSVVTINNSNSSIIMNVADPGILVSIQRKDIAVIS
ncbi:MAG: hypothetical protein U9N13_06990 [Euryarchaeota archaeon]|nr:hypothetical protein [Euryarchaeota archaeon]